MKLSKPKKKTIARIIAVISIILFCYYYSTIKTPYSSVQKIVSHLEKTEHAEILDILSQKEVSIIYYKTLEPSKTILNNRLVYRVGDKFYIDDGGSSLKSVYSKLTFSHYISIKKLNGYFIINVTSQFLENPMPIFEVKDNITSSFERAVIKLDDYSTVSYLVILDTLPQNYVISINDNQISIN
jgi:hypothetical protein